MFVTALAAGLLMLADATPAAQAVVAKPEMKRVCTKVKVENSNIKKLSCYMEPVKPADSQVAKVGEQADASTNP